MFNRSSLRNAVWWVQRAAVGVPVTLAQLHSRPWVPSSIKEEIFIYRSPGYPAACGSKEAAILENPRMRRRTELSAVLRVLDSRSPHGRAASTEARPPSHTPQIFTRSFQWSTFTFALCFGHCVRFERRTVLAHVKGRETLSRSREDFGTAEGHTGLAEHCSID